MIQKALGEILTIKHGFPFSGECISTQDNGKVLVTPGNFKIGGGFQEEKCKFYNGAVPKEYVLKPNDFIVTMTDLSKDIDTLGYSALVPASKNRTYLHNQRIGLVNVFDKNYSEKYIYYLMQTHEYQRTIANTSTGSTVHHTSPSKIGEYRFSAPDFSTQQKIADTLSAYDDLIENNRKQIKLLEEAAQRLYKEWFIDLRFPGWEQTKITNGLPEGWILCPLADVFAFVRGKSYSSRELSASTGELMVNLKNICAYGGYNRGEEKLFTGKHSEAQTLAPNDVVMGVTDMTQERRLVGRVALVPNFNCKMTFSMDLIKLIPKKTDNYFLYSIMRYGGLSEKISHLANGVNVLHLKPEAMMSIVACIPDDDTIQRYHEVVSKVFARIDVLQKQCEKAAELRNRLLPRLMREEIEV